MFNLIRQRWLEGSHDSTQTPQWLTLEGSYHMSTYNSCIHINENNMYINYNLKNVCQLRAQHNLDELPYLIIKIITPSDCIG